MASERIQRQIDRLLDEAEQASDVEDWETVQDRVRRVLTFYSENVDSLAYAAVAERSLDDSFAIPSGSEAPPSTLEPFPSSFAPGRYEGKRFIGEG
jgi:hypothetical protein